jgi:hypothetical protein
MIPSLLHPALPLRLVALTSPAAVRGWAVGQLLNATVIKVDSSVGMATLQIGEQRVQAQVAGPMAAGQRLELRVLQAGAQTVMERLPLPQENAARVQQQALRERLPQAVPLRDLLPTLQRAAQNGDAPAVPVANSRTAPTLQAVLNALPALKDLAQPETLKRVLQTSGLFLEANLAQASDADLQQLLPRDLKASLLRLMHVVTASGPPQAAPSSTAAVAPQNQEGLSRPAPANVPPRQAALSPPLIDNAAPPQPRIAEQLRGGIAAIEVNQLKTVAETNQGSSIWAAEVPVRDPSGELRYLRLEVEEESTRRQGRVQKQWSMTVRMDMEPLGPMHARVTLADDSVHTVIWSERPATAALARDHADWLRSQMLQAGLNPTKVQCLDGEPPRKVTPAPAPLVDMHV